MKELKTAIEIDATPDQVWDVLMDFGAYGDWNPFVTSLSGEARTGETLTVQLEPPGRTRYDRQGRRFSVRSARPSSGGWGDSGCLGFSMASTSLSWRRMTEALASFSARSSEACSSLRCWPGSARARKRGSFR